MRWLRPPLQGPPSKLRQLLGSRAGLKAWLRHVVLLDRSALRLGEAPDKISVLDALDLASTAPEHSVGFVGFRNPARAYVPGGVFLL